MSENILDLRPTSKYAIVYDVTYRRYIHGSYLSRAEAEAVLTVVRARHPDRGAKIVRYDPRTTMPGDGYFPLPMEEHRMDGQKRTYIDADGIAVDE